MQCQHVCFVIFIKLKTLEKQQCRERLSLKGLYLPKDQCPKRNSVVTDPLQEFHKKLVQGHLAGG